MHKTMPGTWQRTLRRVMLVFALGIATGAFTAAISEGPTFIDHMEAALPGASAPPQPADREAPGPEDHAGPKAAGLHIPSLSVEDGEKRR